MEILTIVVPDLIEYSKEYSMENSLFRQLEHVRKGTLPAAVGPHPVRTMVNGIDYCGSAIQVPNAKQQKCSIIFNDCEKIALDSDYLIGILGQDTVLTLGKNKESDVYFILADREPEKTLPANSITKIIDNLIRLTTNLKLRELVEIERIRLPIQLVGSFIISVKCEENGRRHVEIFDENLTQCGFVNGFVWKDIVV